MRITADGEVGINSNNPDEELEVFSKTGGNDVGIKLRALGTSSTAESHVPAISFQSDQGDGVTARASIAADRDGGATKGALIFKTRISDNITEAMRIDSSGTSTFTSGTDYNQVRLVDTNSNQTTQRIGVNSQHYLSAEEDVRIIGLFSSGSGASATDNIVQIGGGSSSHNAATSIKFYTSANATTVSGSTRLTIKSNGSLVANPGGSGNTAFGEDAGIALNSNTDHNTLFGYQTGKDLVNGDKNVFVGFGAGFAATNTINSIAIGSGALDAVTTEEVLAAPTPNLSLIHI